MTAIVKLGFLSDPVTGFNQVAVLPVITNGHRYQLLLRYVDGPASEVVFYRADGPAYPVVLSRGRAWVLGEVDSKSDIIELMVFLPEPGTYRFRATLLYGRSIVYSKTLSFRVRGVRAIHAYVDPFEQWLYSRDTYITAKGVVEAWDGLRVLVNIYDSKRNEKYCFPYLASSLIRRVNGRAELSPIALQTLLQVKEAMGGSLEYTVGFRYEAPVTEYLKSVLAGDPEEYFKERTVEELRKQLEKIGLRVLEVEVVDLKLEVIYPPRGFTPDRVRVDTRVRVVLDPPTVPVWLIALAIALAVAAVVGVSVAVTIYSQAMKETAYYETLRKYAEAVREAWEAWKEYYKSYYEAVERGEEPPQPPPEKPKPLPEVKEPSPPQLPGLPVEATNILYALIALALIIAVVEVLRSLRR